MSLDLFRRTSRQPADPSGGEASRPRPALYLLWSLLLLVPCYWQPRLQAGDLSNHMYHAWFARLIESGQAQGLGVARQMSNILFDLLLGGLHHILGAEPAQRLAVSFVVLTFVWGAFAFVSQVAGRQPWHLLISIAMLAYGWVFHMGFFNFYLSLGLCFWALALLWAPTPRRTFAAGFILAVAFLAHGLPVAWTACLLIYLTLARHVDPRWRAWVTAASVLAMLLLHIALGLTARTQWSPLQIANTTGLDQVWIFDLKYYIVLAGLLLVWGWLFLDLLHRTGARQVASSMPFHICVVSAMGVFILPNTVLLPGFQHALVYAAERMSLGVGICVCALLGTAQAKAIVRCALVAVALIFFAFLFHDERAVNSVQDRMQDTVALMKPEGRLQPARGLSLAIPILHNAPTPEKPVCGTTL